MFEAILRDIISFGVRYAPSACIVAVGAVLLSGLFMLWLQKDLPLLESMEGMFSRKQEIKFLFWIFWLAMYLHIVVGITILSRSEGGTTGASFELFRTFRGTFFAKKQIYENILMFVPYSVLLYGLAKPFRRLWVVLLVGAFSSLLIEVTQWITCTGYFEVDDILTNTVGMLLGYTLCRIIEKMYRHIKKMP